MNSLVLVFLVAAVAVSQASLIGLGGHATLVGPGAPGAVLNGPSAHASLVGPDGSHIAGAAHAGALAAAPLHGGAVSAAVSPGVIGLTGHLGHGAVIGGHGLLGHGLWGHGW